MFGVRWFDHLWDLAAVVGCCAEGPLRTVFSPREAELGAWGAHQGLLSLDSHSPQGTGRTCLNAPLPTPCQGGREVCSSG